MTWLEPTLAAATVLVADQLSKALVMARSVAHSTVPGRRFFPSSGC